MDVEQPLVVLAVVVGAGVDKVVVSAMLVVVVDAEQLICSPKA